MIIDCHAHAGKILNFSMPEETIIKSMEKYGVDFTLVSNIQATEVDHKQDDIPMAEQFTQLYASKKCIEFVRKYPDKIGALLWIKPKNETVTDDFRQLIDDHRMYIYGLKVHPYHSNVSFADERMLPYFELAVEKDLVIVTHTASDENSHPRAVEKIAQKYPDLKIVLYHLGLGTDNQEAIDIISRYDNLYGDVSWVKPENMLRAIKKCGSHKIMFGTDNPINGPDTYNDPVFYDYCFKQMKDDLSEEDYDNFMYKTAKKLFKITVV